MGGPVGGPVGVLRTGREQVCRPPRLAQTGQGNEATARTGPRAELSRERGLWMGCRVPRGLVQVQGQRGPLWPYATHLYQAGASLRDSRVSGPSG